MTKLRNERLKLLLTLFWTFLKIGSFTFGGGYAMIPLIYCEIETRCWLPADECVDLFAMSEMTPGPIAVNAATFVGYRIAGTLGGLIATLGVVIPSFLIITIIAAYFTGFRDYILVRAAFTGIRPAIVALIIFAAVRIGKVALKDKAGIAIMLSTIAAVSIFKVPVVYPIIAGIIGGLLYYRFFPRQAKMLVENGDDNADIS